MKKLLHLLPVYILFIVSGYTAHAQLYKVELDEKVLNVPLIIEGKVIDQKSFWNDAHTMIYTSNTVEVYKLFKGTETAKTIEVVTQGGSVGLEYIEASDLLQLDNGKIGIFFCQPNYSNLKSPYTQKILYDVYSSDQGFLRYELQQNIAHAPFAVYKDIQTNLYKTIQEKTGQSFRVIDNTFNISQVLQQNVLLGGEGTLAGITSFSPTTVHGGALSDATNNLLTINGSGFGAVPSGSSAVWFTDGSPNGINTTFPVKYNSFFISSWTDTKIVLKVPSRAATGIVTVVTSNGTAYKSTTSLNVFYSVLTALFKNYAGYDSVYAETRLENTNGLGGYSFLYSTSTLGGGKNFSTAPEKETFVRALNTWKEQVGVNFIDGGTTTTQQVASSDQKNTIMFDNLNTGLLSPLASGVLATTYSKFSGCIIGSVVYVSQKTEFDMVVRNPGVSYGSTTFTVGPCFPADNDIDLETVMLHELGHALNLAHINDTYEGNFIPNLNPAKLMHYQIVNYVDRRSLDNSAYEGGLYTVKKLNSNYGNCTGLFASEMTPLSYTVIANDECPAPFPTTATPANTVVSFDLVHATSNKTKDPQFTAVNCAGTGTSVTDNAYYAFKTGTTSSGSLTISITGYSTTPSTQASCTGAGVRISVYDVSTCPTGQSFPSPITCRTFTGDGPLANITGLAANHTYLLYFDGLRNTKAKFNATFNGTALPITLSKFTGEFINGKNQLNIELLQAVNVKSISIEKSSDGIHFTQIGDLAYTTTTLLGKHIYFDAQPFAGNNYYRLRITDNDGSAEYSNIILLKNEAKRLVYIYPNPVKDVLNVSITATTAARYNCYLYDVSGRMITLKVYDVAEGTQTLHIPFGNIAKGVYVIKIVDADGNVAARQNIIKQ